MTRVNKQEWKKFYPIYSFTKSSTSNNTELTSARRVEVFAFIHTTSILTLVAATFIIYNKISINSIEYHHLPPMHTKNVKCY